MTLLRPRALVVLSLCTTLVASLLVGLSLTRSAEPAEAVTGSQFNAGNIISDAVFYNSSAMTEAQVQSFLNARVPTCRTGYTCLKSYTQNTTSQSAKVEGCSAYTGRANQSAASIIYSVAVACGINPQSLIVLLEKEQGLVSDTWPTSGIYRKAMGYGCPDTADCDANFYGFFNQVYNAAWQFKKYRYNPSIRGYQAGRNNVIQWSPNAACGSSTVYIENQATAGLYIYTPYRPNAAALNNLYGTGDGCSAYGNRNFWRIFNDWFGSTQYGNNLVRTASSATVYLVVGTVRHAINDYNLFTSLSPLGPVAIVSQSYIDSLQAGPAMSRLIGDSGGKLYFADAGKKYHFDTCARVADFGLSCPSYVTLTASQIAKLANGGDITSNVLSTTGKWYRISGGKRAEAIDSTALSLAGMSGGPTRLSSPAISAFPYAAPVMRENVYVQRGTTSSYALWYSGAGAPVSAAMHTSTALGARLGIKSLDPGSFDMMKKTTAMTGLVQDAAGKTYLLTPSGRIGTKSGVKLGLTAQVLPPAVLSKLPVSAGVVNDPAVLRSPAATQAYLVGGSTKRAIPSRTDLEAFQGSLANPTIIIVATPIIDSLTAGPAAIKPGSLVKSPDSDRVSLVDGTTLRPVGSPKLLQALTSQPVRVLTSAQVGSLTVGASMTNVLVCPAGTYLSAAGVLHPLSTTMSAEYGIRATSTVGAPTCANLKRSSIAVDRFVRDANGLVFRVAAGTKRHIVSSSIYTAVGGSNANTILGDDLLVGSLTTAPPIVSANLAVVPAFLRIGSAPAVYLIEGSSVRVLRTWADYLAAAATKADPTIYSVAAATVSGFTTGPDYVRAGSVIRTAAGPEISMVDGTKQRLYIDRMDVPRALGAPVTTIVSPSTPAAYPRGATLTTMLQCGANRMIGLGGVLYPVTDTVNFPGPYLAVDPTTCASLPAATKPLSRFLRSDAGVDYQIDKGTKRRILTAATFTALGGTSTNRIAASDYSLSLFPNGADLP
ncbi:hypothetical protein WJX64_08335 [Leifsonia sp. YIM 134122]|uniref:Hemagglutinin n=1 Tax=Leifsonia stereocauli TaxID=3134136 RepID=A0ABU9W3I1_9MICO